MGMPEIGLLSVAISLDSLSVMIYKGAMLSKINFPKLIGISILFGGWQALVLYIGNNLRNLRILSQGSQYLHPVVEILAVAIFCGLGILMLVKALRRRNIFERREYHLKPKEVILLAIVTSVDALLAGIATAFLKVDLSGALVPIIFVNILSVIVGTYIGHHLGCEQKTNAQLLSGIILIIFGIDVLFEYIIL